MAMQALKQACDQFNEELHKMLDSAAPQKRYNMWTHQNNHGSTGIYVNRRELLKTGIISTKTQERSPLEGQHD